MRVELQQGSPEWLAWRKGGIGGSDVATILGDNPWNSSLDVWNEKTGRAPGFEGNAATRRGQLLEPEARLLFNLSHQYSMEPACYQSDEHPFIRASLDGISECGEVMLEIKCSGDKVHQKVIDSKQPPSYYLSQMMQGMYCSGAKRCWYMSYNPDHATKAMFIEILRDDAYIAKLVTACCEFWKLVESDTPPEIEEEDLLYIDDPAFDQALNKCLVLKEQIKLLQDHEKAARQEAAEFTDDGNCRSATAKMCRIIRKGSINMDKLRAHYGITDDDLEQFRNSETYYWSIKSLSTTRP